MDSDLPFQKHRLYTVVARVQYNNLTNWGSKHKCGESCPLGSLQITQIHSSILHPTTRVLHPIALSGIVAELSVHHFSTTITFKGQKPNLCKDDNNNTTSRSIETKLTLKHTCLSWKTNPARIDPTMSGVPPSSLISISFKYLCVWCVT